MTESTLSKSAGAIRNKRNTVYVVYQGRRVPRADLADRAGVALGTFVKRLNAGWSVERAVNEKVETKYHSQKSKKRRGYV